MGFPLGGCLGLPQVVIREEVHVFDVEGCDLRQTLRAVERMWLRMERILSLVCVLSRSEGVELVFVYTQD